MCQSIAVRVTRFNEHLTRLCGSAVPVMDLIRAGVVPERIFNATCQLSIAQIVNETVQAGRPSRLFLFSRFLRLRCPLHQGRMVCQHPGNEPCIYGQGD